MKVVLVSPNGVEYEFNQPNFSFDDLETIKSNWPYFVGEYQFWRDNVGRLWRRSIKENHDWTHYGEWKKVKG